MAEHCCKHMHFTPSNSCDLHPNRFERGECHIHYDEADGSYGLIERPQVGGGRISIDYCPWCGTKLEKREQSGKLGAAGD